MNLSRFLYIGALVLLASPVWAQNELSNTAKPAAASALAVQPVKMSPLNKNATDINDTAMVDTLQLKDMDIRDVFKLLSEKTGINIIAGQGISGQVTIYLKNVKLKDVLRIVLGANNLAYAVEDGVVHVMPAQEFERRFGTIFGGDIQTKVVKLYYTDTVDMVSMLNQVKSTSGKLIAEARSNTLILMDSAAQIELMEKFIKEVDVPITTKVFELSYAKVKDVAEKIDGALLSKSGSVKFDEPSNKLIVSDTPQKVEQISKIIAAFDIKRQQVLIEAKIVQVVLSDQTQLGVDWEGVVRRYHDLDVRSHFDILDSADRSGTLSIGTLADDNYSVLIQALSSVGNTNILSSPRITTINGQEAKILVGSTEPYVTSTTTTPSSGPTTTAESVNFIEVGIKLYVTPQIHKDNFITMKLKPEVSSVTRTLKTSNNNTIPVVDTSEAETTVTVKDGVTIVIGGLIKDEKIVSNNKVPLLGDIPVVGGAFRNTDDLKRKTEIVLFLTPRIITGDVPAEEKVPVEEKATAEKK